MAKRDPLETLKPIGLNAWEGAPRPMDAYHRHDDIEINYVHQGSVTYLFGPSLATLPPRQLTMFWAALPHLLVDHAPATRMSWVTMPLSWLLQWQFPESFTRRLMTGQMVTDQRSDPLDPTLLQRWASDLASKDEALREIVALEVEARLRRASINQSPSQDPIRRTDATNISKVERMASYISQYYTRPIVVAQIAEYVGLHPNYAMTLFRRTCGLSLVDYITRHRISHAQRLLATTNRPIIEVALDAGFGSLSRFYEAFSKTCECTPRQYRNRVRP